MKIHFGPGAIWGQRQAVGDNTAEGASLGLRIKNDVTCFRGKGVEIGDVVEISFILVDLLALVPSTLT